VGSIDPRCETVRGTHWPKKSRVVVWSSRRGNHLGQRFKPTASTGRTYGCKRSDQTVKNFLWHGGRPHMGPCVRVWSREIGERFQRSEVVEAFQSCPIVVGDKAVEEGVTIGLAGESATGASALGFPANSLGDATVEALDETVGLRPIRSGQAVIDLLFDADEIERVMAGRPALWLVLHIDGEAVGELGAIVGQDGVNTMWEVGQETREEARRRLGVAPSVDLDIDVAGGAVDRDEDIAFAPLQGRQMLEIDVDEADRRLLKDADAGRLGLLALADRMAMEAAMDGASGKLLVDATSHHLDDIVQRQL